MPPEQLMQLAIAAARAGIAAGQSPFGCAIASEGSVLACAHNMVLASCDITAHAEMLAVRAACRALGRIHLLGADVATTCEPCPMCMAALHWARVGTVYYGATIADASHAGFNELGLAAADVVRIGGSQVRLVRDVLADECRLLFDDWKQSPQRQAY
jgi:tRNA(Arg) A34 adenosine deaminase TadA